MFYRAGLRFVTRHDYTFRQEAAAFTQPTRRIQVVPPHRAARPAMRTADPAGVSVPPKGEGS